MAMRCSGWWAGAGPGRLNGGGHHWILGKEIRSGPVIIPPQQYSNAVFCPVLYLLVAIIVFQGLSLALPSNDFHGDPDVHPDTHPAWSSPMKQHTILLIYSYLYSLCIYSYCAW
jgi:hypothetical protein